MFRRYLLAAVSIALCVSPSARAHAQSSVLDDSLPPGANYDKAQFRFWAPQGAGPLRAVLVLVPGSNGDGRAMAQDTVWQAFATRNRLAIVACRFTDKPHDQSFIEEYVDVSRGSGQALLDIIGRFASRANHPEISDAPLVFWGMSAGGQFDYEFAAWKPDRVAAFVVNKGGIYYTALTSRATRAVPALLFIGGKDLESRVETITGLFALNQRGGALWALTEEPNAAHIVGRSRDLSIMFFDDVLPMRIGDGGTLKSLAASSGFIGDPHTGEIQPAPAKPPTNPTSWLPTERVARAWRAVVTDQPFEPKRLHELTSIALACLCARVLCRGSPRLRAASAQGVHLGRYGRHHRCCVGRPALAGKFRVREGARVDDRRSARRHSGRARGWRDGVRRE